MKIGEFLGVIHAELLPDQPSRQFADHRFCILRVFYRPLVFSPFGFQSFGFQSFGSLFGSVSEV